LTNGMWVYRIGESVESRVEAWGCMVCRGVARFCKLNTCPYYRYLLEDAGFRRISGSGVVAGPTPPTILVGERGYPRVLVGPAVGVAESLDVGLLEKPSSWLDLTLERLLAMRLSLLYGRVRRAVGDARKAVKLVEIVQESAASSKPVDVEMSLSGGLSYRPGFGVRAMPYGPSAKIGDVKLVGDVKVPKKVESLIGDMDLRAGESLAILHRSGLDEYYLARVFSAGLLGRRWERRLVPTEWSITAVDDILSRKLYEGVREMGLISDFRVHSFQALENAAHIILTPTPWMYELLEGWLKHPAKAPYSDYEFLRPRRTYADNTGGAYYAVRLSLLRYLYSRGEQAGAIVFFEVLPGWIPLGVWRFREICRKALERPGARFQTLKEALENIAPRLRIPIERYLETSRLISFLRGQPKLTDIV